MLSLARHYDKLYTTINVFFLPQNAPKCTWQPESTQTGWGTYSTRPDSLAAFRQKKKRKKGDRKERWKGRKRNGGKERV